jgi:hypothetical protein
MVYSEFKVKMRSILRPSDNGSPSKYTGRSICDRLVKNLNKVSKKWNNQSHLISKSVHVKPNPTNSNPGTKDTTTSRIINKSTPNLKIPGFISPRNRESPAKFHKIMNTIPDLVIKTQALQDGEIAGRRSRMKAYKGLQSPRRAFSPDVTLSCIGKSDSRPATANIAGKTVPTNRRFQVRQNITKPKKYLKTPTKVQPVRLINDKEIIGVEFRLRNRQLFTASASIRSSHVAYQTNSSSTTPTPFRFQPHDTSSTPITTDDFLPRLPSVQIRHSRDEYSINIHSKLYRGSNEKGTSTLFMSDDEETYNIDSKYL